MLEKGYRYRDQTHRSLTGLARQITGIPPLRPRVLWSDSPMRSKKPSARVTMKRCAIYTRKSSEEGLEQEFNSLHAQRESCEAYIKSQAGEGWRVHPTAYDDDGESPVVRWTVRR